MAENPQSKERIDAESARESVSEAEKSLGTGGLDDASPKEERMAEESSAGHAPLQMGSQAEGEALPRTALMEKIAGGMPEKFRQLVGGSCGARQCNKKPAKSSIEDPRRIIRHGLMVVVAFFLFLALWAVFAKLSGAVVAPGKVKIETERKTVQHLEGGIVESILVREGDEVEAGQTLIVLESIQVDASVDMLRKHLLALMAAHARYAAEKDLREELVWPEELLELTRNARNEDGLDREMKIFLARREALNGQISMLRSQASQIRNQISGLEEQLRAEETIIRTLVEELGAKRRLYKQRYLEKPQILELERTLASHRGIKGNLEQSVAETRKKLEEALLRIDDVKNRFVEEAASQTGRFENEILQTMDKLRPLRDAKTRLHVVAPVSGRVVELKVHSKGGVVRPGEPLMDVVPTDTPLIVEVHVPVEKIAKVHMGQDAQVQLDAFDVRVTPLIRSRVVYISADRLEERTPNGIVPYYMCWVEADPKAVEEAKAYLTPGMPATVFITTQERTVLYTMLEPFIKSWTHALRE